MYSGCTNRGHAPTRVQSIHQTLLPSPPLRSSLTGPSRAVVVQTNAVPNWLSELVRFASNNDEAGQQAGKRGRLARAAKRTPAHISITHVEIGEDLVALIDQKRSRIIWVMTADGDSEPLASKVKRLLYLTKARDVWVASQHASAEMPLAKAIMRACIDCTACEVNTKLDTFHPAQVAMMLEGIPPCPSDGITIPVRKAFAKPNKATSKEMRLRRPKEDEYTYMHMRKRRFRAHAKDQSPKPRNKQAKHASLLKPILEQKMSPTVIGINGHLLLTQNRHAELLWSQFGHMHTKQGQVGRALGFLRPLPGARPHEIQKDTDDVLNDDYAFREVEIVDPTDPAHSQSDQQGSTAHNRTTNQHQEPQQASDDDDRPLSSLHRVLEAVNRTLQREESNRTSRKALEPRANHSSMRLETYSSGDATHQDEESSGSNDSQGLTDAEENLMLFIDEPAGSLQDEVLMAVASIEQKRQEEIGWVKDERFEKVKLHIEAWLENNELDFVSDGAAAALVQRQPSTTDNEIYGAFTLMDQSERDEIEEMLQMPPPAPTCDEPLVLRRPKLRPQSSTSPAPQQTQEAQIVDASDLQSRQQARLSKSDTSSGLEAKPSQAAQTNKDDSTGAVQGKQSNSQQHQADSQQPQTEDPDFQLLQAFIEHMNQAALEDDDDEVWGVDEELAVDGEDDSTSGTHDAKTATAGSSNQPVRNPTDSSEEVSGLAAFANMLRNAKSVSVAVTLPDGSEHTVLDMEPSKMSPGTWQQIVDSAEDQASGKDRQPADKSSKPHKKDKSSPPRPEKVLAEVLGMIGRKTDQADNWVLNTSAFTTASKDDGSTLPFNCQMSFGPDEQDVTVFFNINEDVRKDGSQNLGSASNREHLTRCYILKDAPSGMEMRMLNSVIKQLHAAWALKPHADSKHPEFLPTASKQQGAAQQSALQPPKVTTSSTSKPQPEQATQSSIPAKSTDATISTSDPGCSNDGVSAQSSTKETADSCNASPRSQIDTSSVGNISDAVSGSSETMSSTDRSGDDAFCIVPPPADSPAGQPVVSKEAKNNFYSNAISSHNSSETNTTATPEESAQPLASKEQPSSANQPSTINRSTDNGQPSQSKALEAHGLDPVDIAEELMGRKVSREEAEELLAALASAESMFKSDPQPEDSSAHKNGQDAQQASKGSSSLQADESKSSQKIASTKASASDSSSDSLQSGSNNNSSPDQETEGTKAEGDTDGSKVTIDDIVAAYRRGMEQAYGGGKKAKKQLTRARRGRGKGIHEVTASSDSTRPGEALKSLFEELASHLPGAEPLALDSVAGKSRTTRSRELKLRVTSRVREVYRSWTAHGRGLQKYSDLLASRTGNSMSKHSTFSSLEAAQVVSRLVDILSRRCDGLASKEGRDLVVVLPTPSLAQDMIEAARAKEKRAAVLESTSSDSFQTGFALGTFDPKGQAPQQMQTGQFIVGEDNIIELVQDKYTGFGGIKVLNDSGKSIEQELEEEEEDEDDRVSQSQLLELLSQCWTDWEQELMAANVKATGMGGSQM